MSSKPTNDRQAAEDRFAGVFAHLDFIVQYARRRGARDPDGVAADAMATAWRRLADIPADDPRPWLIVTTRNLLRNEHRREPIVQTQPLEGIEVQAPVEPGLFESVLDADLERAMETLTEQEREALLLIAWDDLTPAVAARSLGISGPAFRVRLHRARQRLGALLATQAQPRSTSIPQQQWKEAS